MEIKNIYSKDKIIDFIEEIPKPIDVFQARQVAHWDVPVTRLTICISANPGHGKDHTWRYMFKKFKQVYPNITLNVENQDMFKYFENINDSTAQFHVFPDTTNLIDTYTSKERNELKRLWTIRRHTMYQKIKNREKEPSRFGILVNVLCMHRLHGVPPPFNTDFDWLLVKSLPDNEYDANIIKHRFGKEAIQFLSHINQQRQTNKSYLGYGIIKTAYSISAFHTPLQLS